MQMDVLRSTPFIPPGILKVSSQLSPNGKGDFVKNDLKGGFIILLQIEFLAKLLLMQPMLGLRIMSIPFLWKWRALTHWIIAKGKPSNLRTSDHQTFREEREAPNEFCFPFHWSQGLNVSHTFHILLATKEPQILIGTWVVRIVWRSNPFQNFSL